jgi:predicted nuclease of restriction endonuclease-like (RecB) superfamily
MAARAGALAVWPTMEMAEPTTEPIASDSYGQFLADLKGRIQTAQLRASQAVNRELVLLYWQIGRDILDRQERESWGAKVIDRLATDLKRAFPDMKGFSPRNLKYMRAFAEAWREEAIVQAVLAQITWYHNLAVLEKLTSPEDRIWYARADLPALLGVHQEIGVQF